MPWSPAGPHDSAWAESGNGQLGNSATGPSGSGFFLFAQLPSCPIAGFSPMRITAGEHRGQRLRTPKGSRTRPTSDLLRQAIFNVVGPRVAGARVLDLFAGTGALGLEALSRGAADATFVERDRPALTSLRANLVGLGLSTRARIVARDAQAALAGLARAVSLVPLSIAVAGLVWIATAARTPGRISVPGSPEAA